MANETTNVNIELMNRTFCDKVFHFQIKEAMENSSLYIRQKLYEDGILRRLFESRTVVSDELDPEMDTDNPSIIVEIELEVPSATFVPFPGTGDRNYFYGKRFRENHKIYKIYVVKPHIIAMRGDVIAQIARCSRLTPGLLEYKLIDW